jgi:hypothetical protein
VTYGLSWENISIYALLAKMIGKSCAVLNNSVVHSHWEFNIPWVSHKIATSAPLWNHNKIHYHACKSFHLSLSWDRPIQSTPFPYLISILVLYFHLRLGLTSAIFISDFSTHTPSDTLNIWPAYQNKFVLCPQTAQTTYDLYLREFWHMQSTVNVRYSATLT